MATTSPAVIMTVGYEGRDIGELLEDLASAGVEMVVDVRLTPLSRKPGLSKTILSESLHLAGIDYLHLPQLGNPRDNRRGYRNADAEAVERFRLLLGAPDASQAVSRVRALAKAKGVALLCFERDAAQCHRALISEEIAAACPGMTVHHL